MYFKRKMFAQFRIYIFLLSYFKIELDFACARCKLFRSLLDFLIHMNTILDALQIMLGLTNLSFLYNSLHGLCLHFGFCRNLLEL